MNRGVKVASGEMIKLKTNFQVGDQLGAFYKGGPVHLSKDGSRLFATCENAVKVVSCSSGRVEHSIEEDEDHVTCFAVSGEGVWLVIGWRSLLLKQYDLKTWHCMRSWKGHAAPVMSMDFDASGTLLATGGSDSVVNVWDLEKQYCTHNFRGSKGVVNLTKFHPDHQVLKLFTASADYTIRVWDLTTSKCVMVLKNHVSAVTSLGFSPDGRTMLSGGRDQVIHVWDLPSGNTRKTVPVFEAVEGLVVLSANSATSDSSPSSAPHSVMFATAGSKGLIRVWHTNKPHPVHTLEPLAGSCDVNESHDKNEEEGEEVASSYTGLLYCEHLEQIVGVTYDHNIVFIDSRKFEKQKQFVGYLDEVLDMRFVGEEEGQLAVATNSELVKVFERDSFGCQLLAGHTGIVLSLDVGASGSLLATGSKDNTIRLWKRRGVGDSEKAKVGREFVCVAVGTGHTHAVEAVAVSKVRGNFVVSASLDCTMKLWSLKGVFKEVRKADIVRLKVKYTQLAHEKDINSLDISPNDKLIVSASQDKTAKLWKASDGTLMGTFRGHRRGIWSVKFSPVDQCVLTASGDSTLKLWAIGDFSCIKTFEGHTNSALKAIFLTRGMQIASSGSDGLVKLWTIKTSECVATLDQHTEKIWSLASSADGEVLVSGGADSLVCLWKDVTEQVESEAAAEREKQLLQEQELSNLLHQKDYLKAVGVAISLDQPYRVLTVLKDFLENGNSDELDLMMKELREDQLNSILKYACVWNQNSRHSLVAQTVLSLVMRRRPPEQLLEMEGLRDLLEGFIPYTERHFQRICRLQQLSTFIEYTRQCMKLPAVSSVSQEPTTAKASDSVVTAAARVVDPGPVAMDTDPVVAKADSSTSSQEERICDSADEEGHEDHVTSTTGHMTGPPLESFEEDEHPEERPPKPKTSKRDVLRQKLARRKGLRTKLHKRKDLLMFKNCHKS